LAKASPTSGWIRDNDETMIRGTVVFAAWGE